MNFLYPAFLYASALIAVPIIIHLFNFRTHKVLYFSNIQFLKNINQETKSKSRLKNLLVLLCRILTILALVIAFSQPYIPLANSEVSGTENQVAIYVDNSFSMEAESTNGNLLEVAKNKARSIIDAYPATCKFMLLTNDFEQKHQHFVSKEQFLDYLSEIKTTPTVRKTNEIFSRQEDFLTSEILKTGNAEKQTFYYISDFQKSSTNILELSNDTSMNVRLMPLSTQPTNNMFIDSVWFDSPSRKLNQSEILFVKLVNNSEESYQNIPLELFINDSLKALGTFNIEKNASAIVELNFTNTQTGILNCAVKITDYPITYDNIFYFNYSIASQIKILCINKETPSKYINALFGEDAYFAVDNVAENNVQTSAFRNYQLIILNEPEKISSGLAQDLSAFIKDGGNVLLFPDIEGSIDDYNAFLKLFNTNYISRVDTADTRIKTIEVQNEIFTNVFRKIEYNADLPIIRSHWVFSNNTQTDEEALLVSENNHNILSRVANGNGFLYMAAIPLSLESSNFAEHILFVPTVYNIALYSQYNPQIYYVIGKDNFIQVRQQVLADNDYNVYHISKQDGSFDFIPQQSGDLSTPKIELFLQDNVKEANNYYLTNNEAVLLGLAFNYQRTESDIDFYTSDELLEHIQKQRLSNFSIIETNSEFLTKTLKEIKEGQKFWKWFIWLALFFLAAEIAILKLKF